MTGDPDRTDELLMTKARQLAERIECGHNDHMTRSVGARELKVRLGMYLRQVRQGHTLVVTDRGQPVAELRPIDAERGDAAVLATLEVRGLVRRPIRKGLTPFRPIVARGKPLSTAVTEDRGDRF